MKLRHQPLLALVLALGGLSVVLALFSLHQDSAADLTPSPTPVAPGNVSSSSPAKERSGSTNLGASDDAQELQAWRDQASLLEGRLAGLRQASGIVDADPHTAAAELAIHPEARIQESETLLATNSASLDRARRHVALLQTIDFDHLLENPEAVEIVDAKTAATAGHLQEALVSADPANPAVQNQINADRAALSFWKGLRLVICNTYIDGLESSRAGMEGTLQSLRNPARLLADYRQAKSEYLDILAQQDAAEARAQAARLAPLPPERTRNWRQP